MKYRNIGKMDADLSLLGFGCMRFPTKDDGKIDREKAFEMLDCAYKAGVNYYDTAYFYHNGESEVVLGEWLKTIDRDTVNVVTKSPVHLCDSREDFFRKFDEQRTRLGVEVVDFYLLHSLDKTRFDEKVIGFDLLSAMEELQEKGWIKKIGFSFHDEYPVFEEIINSYHWDFCQIQLNYMDINHQAGIKGYELAASKGIAVSVMEPIKGGSLSDVPKEVRARFDTLHPEWSSSSWAIRWVASLPNVMVILSGMSAMEHVIDNLNTVETFEPLTKEELGIVEEAGGIYRSRTKVPCTACQYCMPCVAGVKIPSVFTRYNTAFIYDDVPRAKSSYMMMSPKTQAHNCIECGACIEKCPQHINIPEELKKAAELFK